MKRKLKALPKADEAARGQYKQTKASIQTGGLDLPGKGRAKVHEDKSRPSPKKLRKQWKQSRVSGL